MSTNPNPFGGGGGSKPYQFAPESYGARRNGKIVVDGAITNATRLLTCATSNPFTPADVGKSIHVGGAGGGTYTPLCTTIQSYVSASQVNLTALATSTVASGAIVAYATDDTAAIQSAVNAAVTYAQANQFYAEVVLSSGLYGVGSPAVTGGSTLGNAQITLPVIATTGNKVTLVFKGVDEMSALNYWVQQTPLASGAVLVCLRNDGTNSAYNSANGQSVVVGGPTNGYGGPSSLFSNMLASVNGVGIMLPYNGTFGGWDFFGVAEATLPNWSVMALAVPPATPSVPSMSNPGNITNPQSPVGVTMPDVNNNDNCFLGRGSVEGINAGVCMSEHSYFVDIRGLYCQGVVQVGSLSATGMPHSCGGQHLSAEISGTAIVGLKAGSNVKIDRVDLESTNAIFESSTFLNGEIGFTYNGTLGATNYNALTISSPLLSVRVKDLHNITGPVSAPQAPPATGVAWQNLYWRDAWITLNATTITSVAISNQTGSVSVNQNISGTPTTYTFFLPAGYRYTPAFTGALTHTVTLV